MDNFFEYFNTHFQDIKHPHMFEIRFLKPGESPTLTQLFIDGQNLLRPYFSEEDLFVATSCFAFVCKHLNDMQHYQTLSREDFQIVYPKIVRIGLDNQSFQDLIVVAGFVRTILLEHRLEHSLEHHHHSTMPKKI